MKNRYFEKLLKIIDIDLEKKLFLYGAGERGQEMASTLSSIEIPVFAFCDKDEKKHGTKIVGLPCFSPDILKEEAEASIIVCIDHDNEVYEVLNKKYAHVQKGKDIRELLNGIMPKLAGYDGFYPIGHFYSLYPNLNEIDAKREMIFDTKKKAMSIDFHEKSQLNLLHQMKEIYKDMPEWICITEERQSKYRYRYLNQSFSPADAILLHCMLRILKPCRMIEVGSGWSSAITLDTNEFYFNQEINLTFIEPYPALLKSILKSEDTICLLDKALQEISLDTFQQLEAGDILFIDSTHVSKTGSDVNYLFFEILPRLKTGVYIHLHDIFYPFEYPEEWLKNGMVWNELYLLRAFLMNNKEYEIVFFQNMMEKEYMDLYREEWQIDFPIHGGSIWIQKRG